MIDYTNEIVAAAESLRLNNEQFRQVSSEEASTVLQRFLNKFVEDGAINYLWENFKSNGISKQFNNQRGFERISKVVPNFEEPVYFIVPLAEDSKKFSVFLSTPICIQRIIGECSAFEYYLTPKDISWLFCENHHDYVIVVGSEVEKKLAKLPE